MTATVKSLVNQPYKYGFVTDIETESIPHGLNEDVIRLISAKKQEPEFMLEFRLKAYHQWLKMTEPNWPNVTYPPVDYQSIVYYSAPKQKEKLKSLEDVDPVLLETFEKLGIPLSEQKRLSNVAVDAILIVFRSPRPSESNWPRKASSSAQSPKRSKNILSWCRSMSAASFRSTTIITPP